MAEQQQDSTWRTLECLLPKAVTPIHYDISLVIGARDCGFRVSNSSFGNKSSTKDYVLQVASNSQVDGSREVIRWFGIDFLRRLMSKSR